ncbi:MAG: sigma-54-dependent transcriptional regulator [Candidatus Omnitrophota bacterium]
MDKEHKSRYNVLIVDDEPLIRESLYESLRIDGYRAHMAPTAEEAMDMIRKMDISIVLTDMKLPGRSGLDLISDIKLYNEDIEVILITGFGSIDTAVEAMRKGADDYITKPVNDEEIKQRIEKIINHKIVMEENRRLRQLLADANPRSCGEMLGVSAPMQKVYHIIESVANSNATILVTGESGTGKGLAARAIHEHDDSRRDKPFVEVSCGALSETLLESELFGHVKGAFTGAIRDKEGRFEYARGGTIFLDEIDSFSPMLQVKLLRVLQDGVFERVGDNVTRKTDARIVVATNRDLPELVEKGEFREDLYYRINVIAVRMPPLRERKDDLEMLIEHFVNFYSQKNKKQINGVSDDVIKLFSQYPWPGNIRELENAIEGAVIMCKGDEIDRWDIPSSTKFEQADPGRIKIDEAEHGGSEESQDLEGTSLKEAIQRPERDLIISVLESCDWNRNQAAERLEINRTTLYNKMKKYNIEFKKPGRSK